MISRQEFEAAKDVILRAERELGQAFRNNHEEVMRKEHPHSESEVLQIATELTERFFWFSIPASAQGIMMTSSVLAKLEQVLEQEHIIQ